MNDFYICDICQGKFGAYDICPEPTKGQICFRCIYIERYGEPIRIGIIGEEE